jgi:hypothetical protein
MSRREQTGNRYELITCSLQGHVLVGTDAETVTDDDAFAVRLGIRRSVVSLPPLRRMGSW